MRQVTPLGLDDLKAFIQAFKVFFEELWRDATDIHKICEIETGEPAAETYVIRDEKSPIIEADAT